MKLSIFLPSLSGGGAERVIYNLIQGFEEFDIHLELIVAFQDGVWQSQLPKNCSIINFQKKHVFQCLFPLVQYLRKKSPEILFSAIDNANLVNILACKLSGQHIKSVISIHQVSSEFRKLHQSPKEKLLNRITNFIFPLADKMVVVSDAIRKDILQNIGIPENKIVTIGNPIIKETDLNSLSVSNNQVSNISTIVAFGRLAVEKDFDTLIRAFHLFLQTRDAQLIIYGEGPERKKLALTCRELNVEKHVSMPGFVDDVFEKLSQADVCVVSSITEGFGNVIVEALACGVPVVSTDCGGPREILQDGEYGALVPIGDVNAMSGAILAALSNKYDAKLLRKRASDFTIENISTKYIQVFNALVKRGED